MVAPTPTTIKRPRFTEPSMVEDEVTKRYLNDLLRDLYEFTDQVTDAVNTLTSV